jgi:rubrerythrin
LIGSESMKTNDNLKAAFAGESQANRRYTAFAKKAEQEGFTQVARLFRAAAEAETVHALNHLRTMKEVESTIENLKTALDGEVHEHKEMYPEFIKIAESENRGDAKVTFNYANEVEKVHAGLYKNAIEAVESGKDLQEKDYFICPICGYTADGEAPDKCPVCGTFKKDFKEIK